MQKLFGLFYEGEKTSRSLEYAIDFLCMGKEGKFHRALNDAYYTAEILQKIPEAFVQEHYSIDCYQNPKARGEEIYRVFENYSKYISREFYSKERSDGGPGSNENKVLSLWSDSQKENTLVFPESQIPSLPGLLSGAWVL